MSANLLRLCPVQKYGRFSLNRSQIICAAIFRVLRTALSCLEHVGQLVARFVVAAGGANGEPVERLVVFRCALRAAAIVIQVTERVGVQRAGGYLFQFQQAVAGCLPVLFEAGAAVSVAGVRLLVKAYGIIGGSKLVNRFHVQIPDAGDVGCLDLAHVPAVQEGFFCRSLSRRSASGLPQSA